ncbi:MAG: MBOAT family O-acyltransferase [Ruthenibacterium sp.]
MVFSSAVFVFAFLPFTLILYYLCAKFGKGQAKNIALYACSLLFYAWGGVQYFVLLLILTACNLVFGRVIDAADKHRKAALGAGVLFDVGVLIYFKYSGFFTDILLGCVHALGFAQFTLDVPKIPLPIGISFFSFQILSYLVDVYRKTVPAQKSYLKLGLYIMMFPQLIAGPIVRYSTVAEEIDRRVTTPAMLTDGVTRFIIGFCKKVLLANSMGMMADAVFGIKGDAPALYAWLGLVCYALQIFYDFSAYSDMAIGLGLIFGFHFNENFLAPYRSMSIREFWRRWHVSLSSWFRDYVYIPLGGSRKGEWNTYRNLLLVFFLTGLWHGASVNFVLWGLFHGLFIILERAGLGKLLDRIPKCVRRIYTLLVVGIGWVLFRADTLPLAVQYLKNMCSVHANLLRNIDILRLITPEFVFFLIIALLGCTPFLARGMQKLSRKTPYVYQLCLLAVFLFAAAYMMGAGFNPFIYFRF